ncbi:hypothetical protein EV292_106120 [Sphingomonas sp. BK235]|nr:DUF167 domain-containing protein [Sphingomonas sp. BK235]TCP33178.1 hypothetical protein EV292_106120 [Sphingomonas sp. BK235]
MRVTPRGGRDSLTAGTDEHLAARLAAAPVDGAANHALVALVARHFGVAKRDVALVAGQTARLKRLTIKGDPATLAQRAASFYAAES